MMQDNTKIYYDLTARETADKWYEIELLKPSIDDFVAELPPRPRILDLGCGPGHESMRLAATGAEVVGIDYSKECIKVARERCPQCKFEVMDFRDFSQTLGKFDGVFACASLIHINPTELPRVMNNIQGVLNDSGKVVLMVIGGEGIDEESSTLQVGNRLLRRTVYRYTKDALQRTAKQFGLEYIRDGFLPSSILEYGWRSYIFWNANNGETMGVV